MTKASPFLRWAGSKRQLLPILTPFFSRVGPTRYIEPFMGSASLFFAVGPAAAILGDTNERLVTTFRQVKNDPEGVFASYQTWSADKETYYRVRNMEESSLTLSAQAARLIYLNRYCFNGLYRTDRSGRFNVPYGGARCGRLPTLSELQAASHTLNDADIIHGDFADLIMQNVKPGDFVYLDPPYTTGSRRLARQQYGPTGFNDDDVPRLKSALELICARGAWFVLSYGISTALVQSFSCWYCSVVSVRRNIAGFAANRRRATELVVTNFPSDPPQERI